MKHYYGKHILSVLDRFKIHPESWSMNVQKLYNILAKNTTKKRKKNTNQYHQFHFLLFTDLFVRHKKTEQFDLPNICSRELCNELIWSLCTFTLSNFIIISSSLFVDCVLLGYAIKQWSLKYLETHFSNINLIPDRKRSSSVDLRHVPMDSPMRLTGALQN